MRRPRGFGLEIFLDQLRLASPRGGVDLATHPPDLATELDGRLLHVDEAPAHGESLAATGAEGEHVSRLGSSAVGTSWPTSASRLAAPMPPTLLVGHWRSAGPVVVSRSVPLGHGRQPASRAFGGAALSFVRRPSPDVSGATLRACQVR